ncbi:MAG: single-stranded-DNA-specific exonuclease RecJ [Candidatus Schekmanbacteria bacterium]|nr:single-stranded-DNA-specific exonuclease RecJ [Candidatus Schekmanbacteria bacterium]
MQKKLQSELGIKSRLADLMINRGIETVADAGIFLWGTLAELHSPFIMKGMTTAAGIILNAVRQKDKICVYGDYDVDGLTGVALLFKTLSSLQADVIFYIPHRLEEGYSLNCQALDEIKNASVNLIVTVDCGITSCNEVNYANKLGMQVIISDHHQLGNNLPAAAAILNPLQPGCPYPFKKLSGVGIALKLAQAILAQSGLIREAADLLNNDLDLVALGTIADMVPLMGENRILVKYGLKQLTNSSKSGIKALKQVTGLAIDQEVSVVDVAYKLAPRLNATGRMSDPQQGLELLVSNNDTESANLAKQIEENNVQRKAIEGIILEQARTQLQQAIENNAPPKAIILAAEGWHIGVIGIVASRIVEEYFRPTIIIGLTSGVGKGSGRSIRNLHLQQVLLKCQDLLLEFGGHEMAAGLSILEENIPRFKERINQLVEDSLQENDFIPSYNLDGVVELKELTLSFWQEIQLMEPFGIGNPAPLYCARHLEIMPPLRLVGNNHLKLKLRQNDLTMEAIGFNMGDWLSFLNTPGNKSIDVIFRPQLNVWQGKEQLQLSLQDIVQTRD